MHGSLHPANKTDSEKKTSETRLDGLKRSPQVNGKASAGWIIIGGRP